MTAEEYLDKYKTQNGYGGYDVTEDDALEAIEMVRKEEHAKALSAYQEVVSTCQNCTKACSYQCGTDCLIDKFKELLNK